MPPSKPKSTARPPAKPGPAGKRPAAKPAAPAAKPAAPAARPAAAAKSPLPPASRAKPAPRASDEDRGRADGRPPFPVVDAHVHVNRFDLMKPKAQEIIRQNPTFKLMERFVRSPEAFLEHMDREGIQQSWLINYCAKDVMGYGWEVNDWVAQYAAADPKRLVAVGGYDPRYDGEGGAAIERLADLGIRALKVHTVHQHLRPSGRRLRPALAECERRGLPVIFHTGTSRFPGAADRFGRPEGVRDVLATFPKLQVVLAHGGRPDHTADAVALVQEHPNAWLDLSSCPPHRLRDYFGDLEAIAHRTLWGSDWPGPGVPGMRTNVDAFLELGLPDEANRKILAGNAQALIPAGGRPLVGAKANQTRTS